MVDAVRSMLELGWVRSDSARLIFEFCLVMVEIKQLRFDLGVLW